MEGARILTVVPDVIVRKKLLLVKQLYQHATLQAASLHSMVNRIMAVIGFDLASETALKAVVGALDASKTPPESFQPLVQQADALLAKVGSEPVPDKANILHVHSLRNDAQHKAKYPNESDVHDCRIYTRDFLRKTMANVWGLDFDKFTLVDTIQNAKSRQFLSDAETALAASDNARAVSHAAAGLTWAIINIKESLVGSLPSGNSRAVMLADAFGHKSSPSTKTFDALEQMQDALVHLLFGTDYAAYVRYRRIAPAVSFIPDGNSAYIDLPGDFAPRANEAEFVVAYCINAVSQIENSVGGFEQPLGQD
jgi:hypothetical protein